MNITVRYIENGKFSEVTIESDYATIKTGLLNKDEAIKLASTLFDAANELLETK